MHNTRGWTLLLLLLITVLPGANRQAFGHAVVIEAVPADGAVLSFSPPRVVLRFNSSIEKKLTRVVLYTREGTRIPLAPVSPRKDEPADRLTIPLPSLEKGSYALQYRVLATDGHATPGLLRFTVSGAATR